MRTFLIAVLLATSALAQPVAHLWRVAGFIHGSAFEGGAEVRNDTGMWVMELDLAESQHVKLAGQWSAIEDHAIAFHSSYAGADVVIEEIPLPVGPPAPCGPLDVLCRLTQPTSPAKRTWRIRSTNVDLKFTRIEEQ